MSKDKTKNVIGDFLTAAIIASGKSQTQIAEEVGYSSHNNISMLKSGKMLFPPEKIEIFAKVLSIDEGTLFRVVMQSRYPDLFNLYSRNAEVISEDEKIVLENYRKFKGKEVEDPALAKMKADEFLKNINSQSEQ
ncbi:MULTISPECIES: helix-turn-helix domain-containing protein [Providencia]|uniref:helix-turn-helix domain-containing protein n=1 Tax=Providencia TaxID=586 RepID=UPI00109CCC4C|nr:MULTISPECIES: helix-turn-helix transcriptional regulator [unclassified Providencia]THB27324.1 XRE family transcriptional regulator [Providencia sp. MGF014]